MIQGSVDRALPHVFNLNPFPTTIDKAGALLYSIATFHPLTDGNKRTGLLSAYIFLLYNGYLIQIPEDSADFLTAVADLKAHNRPTEKDVINWINKHSSKRNV